MGLGLGREECCGVGEQWNARWLEKLEQLFLLLDWSGHNYNRAHRNYFLPVAFFVHRKSRESCNLRYAIALYSYFSVQLFVF